MSKSKEDKSKGGEISAPVSKPKGLDVEKILEGVTLPEGVEEVAITSDGQVFIMPNGIVSARKHQSRNSLDLEFHKL